MTISVWRYSHLALAVTSFLFLALASVTGIVLAFEPVSQKILPYGIEGIGKVSVAEALPVLKKAYPDIIDVSVDANHFIIVKAIDADGKNIEVYTNPITGQTLGKVPQKNAFFEWVTTLHRSLFLHGTGRFFMGLASFLLLLIAISGTALILQRQRGFKRFFATIFRDGFAQYYHVVLGRLSLLPVIIIAVTGIFLSLVIFDVLPILKTSHNIDFDMLREEPKLPPSDFAIFKNISLIDAENIEFPFSNDAEDYFTLKLKDREIVVNQYTGEILSEIPYTRTALLNTLSLDLHTGRASMLWALVLAIASANILFFIWSGFAMTLKRRSGHIKNSHAATDCSIIILVGSENGSSIRYANVLHKKLLANGHKVFLAEANQYGVYPKAEHLILLTATYGLGNAPTNANRFLAMLLKNPQEQPIQFSVVGFGSRAYPDFCQFAFEAHNALSIQEWATPLLDVHTVNDKSPEEFLQWSVLWSQRANIPVVLETSTFTTSVKDTQTLTVIEKTAVSHTEGAFLIKLRLQRSKNFTSGDLLAVYPADDYRERLYSIGKVNGDIQLSVRMYENGLGSAYLYALNSGDVIKGRLVRNSHFHFPKQAKTVIMVSNGTGIAPFLGMIDENHKNTDCYLYSGFRGKASFALYEDSINKHLASQQLKGIHIAYSREGEKQYVKDLLARDAEIIAHTLRNNGVIMICGSLAMQQNVMVLLEAISQNYNAQSVAHYEAQRQVLSDCY